MLITTSTMDNRVPIWQVLKYSSRLRKNKTDDNLLLLDISVDTGHFGSGGRYGQFVDYSKHYAFLYKTLGLKMN